MTPMEFIQTLRNAAQESMQTSKIPASFTIADAALESGWGASSLTKLAMNLFGVKADASWHGDIYVTQTREYVNGEWVMETAKFRKYSTWLESLNDHAAFLINNPRYKKCFDHTDDAFEFAQAVQDAGYATDPSYAQKVIAIIKGNGMLEMDHPVTAPNPTFVPPEINPTLDPGQPAMTNEQYAAAIAARHPTPPAGAATGPAIKK